MKTTKTVLALVIALAGITLAGSALAGGYYRGGHYHGYYGPRVTVGLGFGYGIPYAGYYGYGYPYYAPYYAAPYYAAPAYGQQQPSVYVEQPQAQQAQQAQQPSGYWYFCNDSRAYYPYVKECASGWQRVAPEPQN